jgi:hypothetical protein
VDPERPLGFEFVELANDLEKALGKKVDLTTFKAFKRRLAHPRYRPIAEDVERTLVNVEETRPQYDGEHNVRLPRNALSEFIHIQLELASAQRLDDPWTEERFS